MRRVVAIPALVAVSAALLIPCVSRAGGGSDAVAPVGPGDVLAAAQRPFDAELGRVLFRKPWVSAPASTDSSDGLGPLYNARACIACHTSNGLVRHPATDLQGVPSPALVLRLSVPPGTDAEHRARADGRRVAFAEPTYGLQLQPFAIQGHRAEGDLRIAVEPLLVALADGEQVRLGRPVYRIERPGYGSLAATVEMSPRLAPRLAGLGWLASVPDEAILAGEDPDDRDGDGIRGRAGRTWSEEDGRLVIARFGLKAAMPTLRRQIGEAFAIDMGLSNPASPYPAGDCTERQAACRTAPDGTSPRHGGHEVGEVQLGLVTRFVEGIAPPPRRGIDDAATREGETLFLAAGCGSCHRPTLPVDPGSTGGRARAISPYTDLLLHDMGRELADGRPEGTASGTEWRTPPLWGVGTAEAAYPGRTVFLHDGRAASLEAAILWHGGEAARSRDAFVALRPAERARLIDFLRSL